MNNKCKTQGEKFKGEYDTKTLMTLRETHFIGSKTL